MQPVSRWLMCLMVAAMSAAGVQAQESLQLQELDYTTLPGNKIQVRLGLNRPADFEPGSFTTENPARIAIDLPGAGVALENRNMRVDTGVLGSVRSVATKERARVVLNLMRMVPYEIRTEANSIYVNLGSATSANAAVIAAGGAVKNELTGVDFRRGQKGEGRIVVKLSDPNTVINLEERGDKLYADFVNATLPEKLVRRLDVNDFATPVSTIDAYNADGGSRFIVATSGNYEHMAYQTGNEFTIDVRPLTVAEAEESKKDRFGYSGERLSLNFQNIEVRAVLQLIADFTGLNVVASDTVQGNITLRLKNVPWDQALDIILKTRGLGMRKTGNVVLIAPNDELAEREKKELEAQKQKLDLAPLQTRFYKISYASADSLSTLLKAEKSTILTERGSVSVDERTNTLIVVETADKLDEIAALIEKLDVPVRQVMIESRIVIANDDFSRDLGVRTGVTQLNSHGSDGINVTSGSGAAAGGIAADASQWLPASGDPTFVQDQLPVGTNRVNPYGDPASDPNPNYSVGIPALSDRYNVNLPAAGPAGRIALALLGADFLVDLELSALQTEGRGEVLSNPRVITSNQVKASIEQGVEIPYQESAESGATTVSFKKAVLSLEVTPRITPDDRVNMELIVNKDSVGGIYSGIPSINTRQVSTNVLVSNGDTVVLGGIYEQTTNESESKVPLLGDIPLLGYLFRNRVNIDNKAELLIFVTPKILKDSLSAGMQ